MKKQLEKLFGVVVRFANRDDLMVAVKDTGATAKWADKQQWGSTYYAKDLLKGGSELSIMYTVDDHLAKAYYTFPSRFNTEPVVNVRNFVANKYGAPDY